LALAVLVAPVSAQSAKEFLQKAQAAATAKDWNGSINFLKQAMAADQAILGQADSSTLLDPLVTGLQQAATSAPGDVNAGKNYGYALSLRGDYKGALEAYRKVQGAAAGDKEVAEQIRTLESWVAASGGGGNAAASSGSAGGSGSGTQPPAADGSAGGGGAAAAGGGAAGGSSDPNAAASAGPGGPEVEGLKSQLKQKDDQINELQGKLDELQKSVNEKDAEIAKLKQYESAVNAKGGLSTMYK
jgi:tetratricopeptide (TPR) repeat protein